MNEHHEIESAFFEFRKMKAFLDTGVTVYVPDIPYVPLPKVQEYVYSLLLVDLMSVWDLALNHFFKHFKLKPVSGKNPFQIVADAGHILTPAYLLWYKEGRNKAAHEFQRHDYSNITHATEVVADQLAHWGVLSGKLKFIRLWQEQPDKTWKIGARVGNIPILAYTVQSNEVPQGLSSSAGISLDLSYSDFLKAAETEIHNEKSIIYRDIY